DAPPPLRTTERGIPGRNAMCQPAVAFRRRIFASLRIPFSGGRHRADPLLPAYHPWPVAPGNSIPRLCKIVPYGTARAMLWAACGGLPAPAIRDTVAGSLQH